MHRSIRDRLEDLIGARRHPGVQAADEHVAGCDQCNAELQTMRAQAELLRTLRAPETLEPAAGFYARVLQRIEQSARPSIWSLLILSPVYSRVAYASMTLALVAGSYVIASESRDGHLTGSAVASQVAQLHEEATAVGSPAEQRDAVLQNLAAH